MEVVLTAPAGIAGTLTLLRDAGYMARLRERYTEGYLERARRLAEEQLGRCAAGRSERDDAGVLGRACRLAEGWSERDNAGALERAARRSERDDAGDLERACRLAEGRSERDDAGVLWLEGVREPAEHMADSSGGVSGMLWRLAERAGVGLRIDLRAIPILQETVEISNTLLIDPYGLDCVGALLFVPDGTAAVRALRAAGERYAAVIGETAADRKRLLRYGEVERYLTKPREAAIDSKSYS